MIRYIKKTHKNCILKKIAKQKFTQANSRKNYIRKKPKQTPQNQETESNHARNIIKKNIKKYLSLGTNET